MTTDDTDVQVDDSGDGTMTEHLERYKNYLDNLKQGKSSGISSIFGRASDLLPPEVMEIKPPVVKTPNSSSSIKETNSAHDDNVRPCDDVQNDFDDVLDGGEEENDFDDVPDADDEQNDYDDVPDDDDELNDYDDVPDDDERNDYDDVPDDDDEHDDHDDVPDDDDDARNDYGDELDDDDGNSIAVRETIERKLDEPDEDRVEYTNELTVTASNGSFLWSIYFNRAEPVLIMMNDGSSIRNAEGRDDAVLALKTTGGKFKFFILSGLVIDPSTGNIYVEANDGAYTAAFLNNGWQVHQYRTHNGDEIYYATEPFKKGRDRLTMQIADLQLDPATGAVSYDSLDGSASMTLKSRRL